MAGVERKKGRVEVRPGGNKGQGYGEARVTVRLWVYSEKNWDGWSWAS